MSDHAEAVLSKPMMANTTSVSVRRAVYGSLAVGSIIGLFALMVVTLLPGGLSLIDGTVLFLFALTLPTLAVGFWNAAIGYALLWSKRDILANTCPPASGVCSDDPITSRTAILVCIRNEDVAAVADRLSAMLDGLERTGNGGKFTPFVLSDTNIDDIAHEENRVFNALKARHGDTYQLHYRRRTDNSGFKAGNIRDFCDTWGDKFDFALVLDADSYMAPNAILKLVATIEASPQVGILQSFAQSMPSATPFARIFQFGWRAGGLARTIGANWWLADCGPYGGHNAVIRLAPFIAHCKMKKLEGNDALSGDILSHDHIEEVLMRRAGWETRELPEVIDSFEGQPPNLCEFIRREIRWCSGNLQYLRLLNIPGLTATHRVQMALWILHFLGSSASMLMIFIFTSGFLLGPELGVQFDPAAGGLLFLFIMGFLFVPKIAAVFDILARKEQRRAWGGSFRVVTASFGEVVFSTILSPIAAITHAIVVCSVPFGRRPTWTAQDRASTGGLSAQEIVRRLWPQITIGIAWFTMVAVSGSLVAALFMLPIVIGLIGAVPFGMATGSPSVGRAMVKTGSFSLPEERGTAPSLSHISLEALDLKRPDVVNADASSLPVRST